MWQMSQPKDLKTANPQKLFPPPKFSLLNQFKVFTGQQGLTELIQISKWIKPMISEFQAKIGRMNNQSLFLFDKITYVD